MFAATVNTKDLMDTPFETAATIRPEVLPFFDAATNTISYVVRDPVSTSCAIIDSVMDIDYAAGRIAYDGADAIIAAIVERGWTVEWFLKDRIDPVLGKSHRLLCAASQPVDHHVAVRRRAPRGIHHHLGVGTQMQHAGFKLLLLQALGNPAAHRH